jgi:hypothetical protein
MWRPKERCYYFSQNLPEKCRSDFMDLLTVERRTDCVRIATKKGIV